MRILNLYIGRNLVINTLIGVAVLTFVMLSAQMVNFFRMLSSGFSPDLMLKLLLYILPETLTWSIPISLLCASVLVFSRLSADQEISALRAGGISLWQIISPGLLWSILLCITCMILQIYLAPECHYKVRQIKKEELPLQSLSVIEPGIPWDFGKHKIYARDKVDDVLKDVSIFIMGNSKRLEQEIIAEEGIVSIDEENSRMDLLLKNQTIFSYNYDASGTLIKENPIYGSELEYRIDLGQKSAARDVERKAKYMTMNSIFGAINLYSTMGADNKHARAKVSSLYVELHKRLALSLSPFAFILIGIPFGIKTQRQETSIGIVISVILALFFYLFIVLADTFRDNPRALPELLMWLPNIVYQLGGITGLVYITRR